MSQDTPCYPSNFAPSCTPVGLRSYTTDGNVAQNPPSKALHAIFRHLYRMTVRAAIKRARFRNHYCVLDHPCPPLRPSASSLLHVRAVCKKWKRCFDYAFLKRYIYCSRTCSLNYIDPLVFWAFYRGTIPIASWQSLIFSL